MKGLIGASVFASVTTEAVYNQPKNIFVEKKWLCRAQPVLMTWFFFEQADTPVF